MKKQSRNYPETIEPYSVLGVNESSTNYQCKMAFLKLICNPDRYIRCSACLAYDVLCNKKKYTKVGKEYKVKEKDTFYFVVIGDFDSLKRSINSNKSLLYKKDELQRNLLYLAARNGYYDICEYLIKKGINVNETQKDGSTPLHGAAFYGQNLIVQLLVDYGANIKIKNNFGSLASEEARNDLIAKEITESENDNISKLYNELFSKGIVSNLVIIKKKKKIVAKKFIMSSSKLPENFSEIKDKWEPAWHGTRYEYLGSIAENGLKASGTKLSNGKIIEPPSNHYGLNETIAGIKGWARAIFVSPSLMYAADICYAKRITSNSKQWACLIQCLIRPDSYTKHPSSIFRDHPIEGETSDVEYRVEAKEDEELIFRVSSKEKNVIVTAVVFVSVNFLDNINEFTEGEIVVNSKEERELLN